jgi:hypothetical protein
MAGGDEWQRLPLLVRRKGAFAGRSTLVHGLAPRPGVDYGKLAQRAVTLCGRILITAISKEIDGIDAHLDQCCQVQS